MAILELKRLQMPRLSTQHSYVDNRGNPRAKMATKCCDYPKNCFNSRANTCNKCLDSPPGREEWLY